MHFKKKEEQQPITEQLPLIPLEEIPEKGNEKPEEPPPYDDMRIMSPCIYSWDFKTFYISRELFAKDQDILIRKQELQADAGGSNISFVGAHIATRPLYVKWPINWNYLAVPYFKVGN